MRQLCLMAVLVLGVTSFFTPAEMRGQTGGKSG